MLLGRVEERARIDHLLADASVGTSGVLVVRGDPGIGKSALMGYAAERADGMTVLTARGVESEAEVPFSGLLELLRPLVGLLERIPPPQAKALRGALALGPGVESDRFIIGAATLSLLAAQAEESPLLVLVDDVHWLDYSSAAAVVFAARRLLADPVAVLLALRVGEAPAVEDVGLPSLSLSGVDRETAAALLSHHAGRAVAPATVDPLFRATGGNPLALVELAAKAPQLGPSAPSAPLPIATSVEQAFVRRIDDLAEETRRALVLAAVDDSGRLAELEEAAGALGVDLSALEDAERAGLVSIFDARCEFRHPLVRSAVYHAAAPTERRDAHRALAEALDQPADADRRAWHLASAAFGPDEGVAAALEQAGRRARGRSAYAAAAASFERAARLTPDHETRARREFAAADAAWLGGDAQRAVARLDDALEGSSDARLRADVQHLRGQAEIYSGPLMSGHDTLVAAASDIEGVDPEKAVVMLADAAEACYLAGRPETMLRTARRGFELLRPDTRDRAVFRASLLLGMALIWNGQGVEGARLLRRAVSIIDRSDALRDDPWLQSAAALGPLWLREAETGRALIARAIESGRAQGALGALPYPLLLAGRDAATSDRWTLAKTLYEEAIGLSRETAQGTFRAGALAGLACVEARQGRAEDCRRHLTEASTLIDRHGLVFVGLWALDARVDLELGLGHLDQAIEALEEKGRRLRESGIVDADLSPAPELVEAYVRTGRASEAVPLAEEDLRVATEKGQPWALARAERCRGLLADDESFPGHFDEAVRLHERTPDRFEQGRTQLCYGERLRRARRRALARVELRAALEAFDRLGADPWAERARLELLATGETARRRDASTIDQLTPQELQIATVLAGGRTTREAATQLFLSPKTIEYHLRHAYQKLGINSREGLARVFARETPDPEPAVAGQARP
jgi:DNA-binding CsgD family transcriptional regulator